MAGDLELHAHPPTAVAENPKWFPTTEELSDLPSKKQQERMHFFLTMFLAVWLAICLVGTFLMTRCFGCGVSAYSRMPEVEERFPQQKSQLSSSNGRPEIGRTDITMAFIQTYLVSLLMVGFSLMTGRLSKADGLDYEVYMILFMLQGLKLLWQACAVTERFGRYSSSTFTLESISAMAPFVADSFDTLKDIIFAGLCFMSEHWFLKIVGVASWIWLPLIYARLLRDEHCASHLSASYFPFDSAPTRAEAEKDNSVAPSTHPTLLQAAPTVQGATVREATSDSRIANFISASVEVFS